MSRARTWVCGPYVFDLATPLVMGILNVTPDSFSDTGLVEDTADSFSGMSYGDDVVATFGSPSGTTPTSDNAIARGLEMVAQGAHIIDVGGESTRPGSLPVSVDEELARVIPVVEALAAQGIAVSVDTSKPEVAAAALAAGASIINDIAGFQDPQMVEVVASSPTKPGLVVMHMQGTPQTMQDAPHYEDVVQDVSSFLAQRASELEAADIDPSRIAIDPGFGFGKSSAHNLEILRRTETLAELGYPLVVAVSRKRTIGEITGEENPRGRVAGSIAAALYAVERGARIARVHDVGETSQAFALLNALNREIP